MKKSFILLLVASFQLVSTCFAYTYRGTMTLSNWWPERGTNGPEIKALTVKWMLSDKEADPEQTFHMQWYLGDHYVYDHEKLNLRELKVNRSPLSITTVILRAEVHSKGQHVGDLEFDLGATPPHGGTWGQEVAYEQAFDRFFFGVNADTFLSGEQVRKLFDEDLVLQNPRIVEIFFGGMDEIERSLGTAQSQTSYLEALAAGDAALSTQSYAAAIEAYESALTLRPGDAAARKRIEQARYVLLIGEGDAALDAKDYAAAKKLYEDAAALRPGESIPRERIQLAQQMIDRAGKYDETLEKLRNRYKAEIEKAKEAQKKTIEMAAMAFSPESEACNLEWIKREACAESHWQRKAGDVEIEVRYLLFGEEDARRQTQYEMTCTDPVCKRFDDASNTFGVTADDYLSVAKRKYRVFQEKGYEPFREQAIAFASRAIESDYQLTAAYLFRASVQADVIDQMGDVEMALGITPDLAEGKVMQQELQEKFLRQLYDKIKTGDIEYVQKALSKELIDAETRLEGKSPLEQAVEYEQIGIIKVLTQHAGSPRGGRVIPVEQQLLFVAARQNKPKVARYLMDKGARADAANTLGETPLSVATDAQSAAVIEVLLGKAALNLAEDVSGSMQLAVEQGNAELVRTFLQKGGNPETVIASGDNLLMAAIRAGNPEVAAILLDKGANPDHSNPLNETPLSLAAVAHMTETTDLLLHAGANDARNLDFLRETTDSAGVFLAARSLLLAVSQNDPDRARLAIGFHPRPGEIPAVNGSSLLDYTLVNGQHEICALLVASGLRDSLIDAEALLMDAVAAASVPVVQVLLQSGGLSLATMPLPNPSPLHVAVQVGNREMVRLLLSESHPANVTDAYGNTPLHLALTENQNEVAMTLIRMQADIHAVNNHKLQGIHLAAKNGNAEMVSSLLVAGADIDAVGESGMTPLHMAVEEGHQKLAEMLLAAGANRSIVDHFDRTPRQIAQQRGDKALARLLK